MQPEALQVSGTPSVMQDIGLRLVTRVLAGAATITFNNDKLVRAVDSCVWITMPALWSEEDDSQSPRTAAHTVLTYQQLRWPVSASSARSPACQGN